MLSIFLFLIPFVLSFVLSYTFGGFRLLASTFGVMCIILLYTQTVDIFTGRYELFWVGLVLGPVLYEFIVPGKEQHTRVNRIKRVHRKKSARVKEEAEEKKETAEKKESKKEKKEEARHKRNSSTHDVKHHKKTTHKHKIKKE